jgi:hypothetical protein
MDLTVSRLLAAALLAALAATAQAQSREGAAVPGTAAAGEDFGARRAALGDIEPFRSFRNADLASAGVGLRNRRGGGIEIAGVGRPVKAAYLYWAVLTAGSPPEAVESVNIQRVFPAPASPLRTIRGGVVGQGPEPCWGSFNGATTVTVYRSAVPLSVADGNGTYVVTLNANAAGATAGQDPWVTSPIPNFEGVSLVIVGTGNGRVALYDRGLAGKTFTARNRQTYSLVLPIDVSRATAVEFHTIQADGQRGVGRRAVAKTADEITVMRDVVIAGPGSQLGDGHWNGGTAAPLPQLWDNVAQDVTAAATRGTGRSLGIRIDSADGDDCLVPVANGIAIFGLGG